VKIALFYNLNFGGAKRVVMDHTKGLQAKGHQVDIYTTNHEKDAFDPSLYCSKLYNYKFVIDSNIPFLKRIIKDYKNFFALKNLHKQIAADIDSRNYDVVLAHPDKFTQSPFLLRFIKTNSVYYCQEPLRIAYEYSMRLKTRVNLAKRIYEEITRWYRKQIDRQNVRSATLTIASCYHVRERMIESYEVYPKVVYCAVDATCFRQMKVVKKNQVFYVGSPKVWEDGYDLAASAMKLIPKKIRPNLHIISWKKENGERLTEEELVTIYNESIVTLCISRLETFGLVPLESMACGTPVIATKVSGHRETIIDEQTGFLIDFEPQEIADKIIFLIQNKTKAATMGKNARKHIEEKWTWESQINNLEDICLRITKGSI
jgi:glycosyltransferase involved in cell wall biosynthesis